MKDLGIIEVADCMDRVQKLRGLMEQGDGWEQIVNEPTASIFIKPDGNDRAVRCTIEMDLTPDQCLEMFTSFDPESLTWMERVTSRNKVKDWGPNDYVIEQQLDIPWAMKYLMSIPETIYLRFVLKKNWPNAGEHAYVAIPYDNDKGQCMEQVGLLKTKSGTISPHEDPKKCTLVTLDSMSPGKLMPDFALKAFIRAKAVQPLTDMVTKFKQSQAYAKTL